MRCGRTKIAALSRPVTKVINSNQNRVPNAVALPGKARKMSLKRLLACW
jgi:hypothetical protein